MCNIRDVVKVHPKVRQFPSTIICLCSVRILVFPGLSKKSVWCGIVVVYRPPSCSLHDNNILIDFLSDFCINREVIVMGDFNLPFIS